MPTKDYVRTPQKRKQTKKKKQTLPIFRIVLAIVLIVLFIFALYQLSQNNESNNVSEVKPQSDDANMALEQTVDSADPSTVLLPEDNSAIEMAELPPLPVLDDEEWEYIDSLPEFSVEVDATGPIESDRQYIMQCGSFRTQERAEELRARVALQGKESRILTSNGSKGLWYRVVLGPYDSKRLAEKERQEVRSGNINGCKIW